MDFLLAGASLKGASRIMGVETAAGTIASGDGATAEETMVSAGAASGAATGSATTGATVDKGTLGVRGCSTDRVWLCSSRGVCAATGGFTTTVPG